ncbi:hypothetical protein Ddye_020379 [Dipteronia dyeriana]|uniref:Uncharacterized protein n=1 Tax=Dipteronia dyeriana TaxID=168575 RepID=A0AAD9U0K4_9ROSI|nr:hypothetical protein Ddye_020379 [Dipteronia dyeriana]
MKYSNQKVNIKALYPSKLNGKEQGNSIISKKNIYIGYLFKSYTSSIRVSLRALLSSTITSASDKSDGEIGVVVVEAQSLELARSSAVLAMAWNGKDVQEWHKHIAYRVAIYALLKMAIEVEVLLSHEHHNNPSPVKTILTRKLYTVEEYIESQLIIRNPELVQLFRDVELPHCMATLVLFAYLVRMTRIFLSNKGIKNFDELINEFLRCNFAILLAPELSRIYKKKNVIKHIQLL